MIESGNKHIEYYYTTDRGIKTLQLIGILIYRK